MILTTRSKVLFVVLAAVAVMSIFLGAAAYRSHVRCAARNAQLQERVNRLQNDARERLKIGVTKANVARFFDEHGMTVTFGYGVAQSSMNAVGCAPFGCGRDDVIFGVSVNVNSEGTVVGEPHVSGIYTDCL